MAVRFDSSTDEYNASNGAIGTGDFTVTLWAKRVTDRNNYSTIICLDDNNANNVIALQTDTDGTSLYMWGASGGTAQDLDTFTAATPANTWLKFAIVREGTTVRVYRNTVGGSTEMQSRTMGSVNISRIRLGDSVSGGEWWNGSVANVKVYNAALTQTEIETEWGNWRLQRTSNAVRHHKFQSGPSTADDSGNGNTLTAVGTPANDAGNPSLDDSDPVSPPVADAGADASETVGTEFTRTGTGTNTPSSFSWSLTSAPAGVTTGVVDSDADLAYTPTDAGDYVFELTATNAGGSDTDSFTLTVTDPPSGGETYTLGKTDDGAGSSASSSNKTMASLFTAEASGTLVAGHFRVSIDSGSTTGNVAVYANDSGAPGALLATSDNTTISNTTEQQLDVVFSGANQIDIVEGTGYWVAVSWQDPGTPTITFSRGSTADVVWNTNNYLPNPFGSFTNQSGPIDVWVEYESGEEEPGTGEITPRTPTVVGNELDSLAADTSTAQVGDFVFMAVGADEQINTPSGWTPTFTQLTGVMYFAGFHRFMDGGADDEPTVTTNSGTRLSIICLPCAGVDTSNPLDTTPDTYTSGGSAVSDAPAPSITTVTENALAISGAMIDASNVINNFTLSGSGWSELIATVGDGRYQEMGTKEMPTPGATGTATWTNGSTDLAMAAYQVALRPAPASAVNTTLFFLSY